MQTPRYSMADSYIDRHMVHRHIVSFRVHCPSKYIYSSDLMILIANLAMCKLKDKDVFCFSYFKKSYPLSLTTASLTDQPMTPACVLIIGAASK